MFGVGILMTIEVFVWLDTCVRASHIFGLASLARVSVYNTR